MKALLQDENHIFAHFPGIGQYRTIGKNNRSRWSDQTLARFKRDIDLKNEYETPEDDWIYLNISGTTFSGLSTRTTLGNTFRSICYVYYYLYDSGIS